MSAMSEIDLVITEVVNTAIARTESWIDDGEAIDDLLAFIGVEVVDAVFNMRDTIKVNDMPFIIGHAISQALVEATILGLGPTSGDPLFQPTQL